MDNVQKADNEREQEQLQQRIVSLDDLPAAGAPYTINEAIVDASEQVTGEAFPDPFDDEHDIEYWLWTGSRLVPASPDAMERLRQQEAHEKEARLAHQKQQRVSIYLRWLRWLTSWRHFAR